MELEIRRATPDDIRELCIFYEKVCESQKEEKCSPQWTWGVYPCRDDIEYAVSNRLFLTGRLGDDIAAAGIISAGDDDAYNHVNWTPCDDVCVLHLFAVSPDLRHRGVGSAMLSAIKSRVGKAIHLDVVEGNETAGVVYRKNGFGLAKHTRLYYDDLGEKGAEMYEWLPPVRVFETERLYARRLRESDAWRIFETWACDPEVTRYLTWPAHKNVEVTKKIVASWMADYDDEKCHRYGLCLKGTDALVGMIDVVGYLDGCPAVGYVLGRAYWGCGYMTEACNAFVAYLFEQGFPAVRIEADARNAASNHVIEKCGFELTGHEDKTVRGEDVTTNWYVRRK